LGEVEAFVASAHPSGILKTIEEQERFACDRIGTDDRIDFDATMKSFYERLAPRL